MVRAEIVERGRLLLPLLETPPMTPRQRRAAEAQEHRDERASTHTGRAVKRHAFTINEFCWSHGISRATCTVSFVRLAGSGAPSNRIRNPSFAIAAGVNASSFCQLVPTTWSDRFSQHGSVSGGKIGRQSSATVQAFFDSSSDSRANLQK